MTGARGVVGARWTRVLPMAQLSAQELMGMEMWLGAEM